MRQQSAAAENTSPEALDAYSMRGNSRDEPLPFAFQYESPVVGTNLVTSLHVVIEKRKQCLQH